MVCLPSCNTDRMIYIWGYKDNYDNFTKDTGTSLHIIISRNLIAQQLKRNKSLEQSSMHGGRCRLPATSIPMPPPIPTTIHHHAPLLLALSLIFHFFDDILEIPVFR